MAPGWTAGGSTLSNFAAYPTESVTIIEVMFDDAGHLALLEVLQQGGAYGDYYLADIVMAAYLNVSIWQAPSGQW